MIKTIKLVLLVIGVFTYGNATEVETWTTEKNGAITVKVDSTELGIKDWIAVYPKNSNTSWVNVLDWKWAKDLPQIRGTKYVQYTGAHNMDKLGDYTVRYFKNNTYRIHKSLDFTIKNVDSLVDSIAHRSPFDGVHEIWVEGFTKGLTTPAPKDWIGIYEKNDDNSWGNVIEWVWAKDLDFSAIIDYKNNLVMPLDKSKYKYGTEYEARYFLNNSFTTQLKSVPFKIKNSASLVDSIAYRSPFDGVHEVWVGGFTPQLTSPAPKDWIGIYEKNDDNSWGNVIEWVWAKDLNFNPIIGFTDDLVMPLDENKYEDGSQYEARYFLNNSFKTELKSVPFVLLGV